jgi:Flp pilus assembly protein protease CpaA
MRTPQVPNRPARRRILLSPVIGGIHGTLLILACMVHGLAAATFGDFTYTDDGTSITITEYSNYATETVEIPAVINGMPVTGIGDSVFTFRSALTSVTIPDSVTSIGHAAFQACSGLANITIPDSVIYIGRSAFASCSGLTSITIPNNVTYILDYTFGGCSGLSSITIPSSVTTIGDAAFFGCSGLTSITISNSVTTIGSFAFSRCSSLTSVTIPGSVTSIGNGAFSVCGGLTSIMVDASNGVFTSDNGVLFNKLLTSILVCPGGITGSYTIPGSVIRIGEFAFLGCSGLESIAVDSSNSALSSDNGVLLNEAQTTLIACPGGKGGSYTIPNTVTNIENASFNGCRSLTSITIPSSVTNIGDSAFQDCSGLTAVAIPSNVSYIGTFAFDSCSGLTSIEIPNSVVTIMDGAFAACVGLTHVTIGSGVTHIASQAFNGCSGLTSVTIGNGVTSIGTFAFRNCAKLIVTYFKGNAPALGDSVFSTNPGASIYYLPGTTGWTPTFGELATVAVIMPTISTQPSLAVANPGENVAFSVVATTAPFLTLTYQWRRNGIAIAGATSPTLALSNVQVVDSGVYTVVITNDAGSVTSNTASLTLTQGNLYTQSQYEAALQMGYNLGFQAGGDNVLEDPNDYGLYSLSQVQALYVGTPLIEKNPVTGNFKLTIKAHKSADLKNYSMLPFSAGTATIDAEGAFNFDFTSTDNTAFFRLETR